MVQGHQRIMTPPLTDYVLGISGLPLARDFRRKALEAIGPLTEAEARIFQGMDAAAALVYHGNVVAAAEEERFNRQTHTHHLPVNAINFCLRHAGIDIQDVSVVTHGFDYRPYRTLYSQDPYSRERYDTVFSPTANSKLLASQFPDANVHQLYHPIAHHHAHAASAYFESGFEDALVLVIDAMGELHSTSVFKATGGTLTVLKQYDMLSSLGMFYSLVTMHLGFLPNSDEYKVMGLAPYGDGQRFLSVLEQCVEYRANGRVFFPVFLVDRTTMERETFRGLRHWLTESLIPPRARGDAIIQDHKDLAAALQLMLSKAVFHTLRHWLQVTHMRKLCIAGGVGFNCTVNGEVLRSGYVDDVYIPPAAGDAGVSVGSALFYWYQNNPGMHRQRASLPLYGPEASAAEIGRVLERHAQEIFVEHLDIDTLIERIADLIEMGKVVAWMHGRMEFGPRALGNRSILADPRRADMKEMINVMVKKRESFRPFAPSVKLEAAYTYFDVPAGQEHPYMLTTVPVRAQFQNLLPAITHIDGSARIQTVSRTEHPLYWRVLDAFERRTGMPVLLNTSFNVAGEPIVCSANDAITTFLASGLHVLGIGEFLVVKMADAGGLPSGGSRTS